MKIYDLTPPPDNLFRVKIVDQFNTLHKFNSDEKLLARLETHMEMVVVAFDRLSAMKFCNEAVLVLGFEFLNLEVDAEPHGQPISPFILEDFGELFIEYFCVEKYITGYKYEEDYAQSYMAAISSISLNLIALACFIGFVKRFRYYFNPYWVKSGNQNVIVA